MASNIFDSLWGNALAVRNGAVKPKPPATDKPKPGAKPPATPKTPVQLGQDAINKVKQATPDRSPNVGFWNPLGEDHYGQWNPSTMFNYLFGGLPGFADASTGGQVVPGTMEDYILGTLNATGGKAPAPNGGGGGGGGGGRPDAPPVQGGKLPGNWSVRRN